MQLSHEDAYLGARGVEGVTVPRQQYRLQHMALSSEMLSITQRQPTAMQAGKQVVEGLSVLQAHLEMSKHADRADSKL